MSTFVSILQVLLPIAYGALVAYFGQTFFRSEDAGSRMRRAAPFAYVVVGLHAVYIGAYTIDNHHCLLATIYELCSLIAFTLMATYTFVELRPAQETSGTGFFVALVAFLLQFVSSVNLVHEYVPANKAILKDAIFNTHVTTSGFGYAAFMLAAIYGGLYLMLFRAIRKNEFGPVFQHVPSLERLERYGLRATAVGFVFLTLAITLGVALLDRFPPAVGRSGALLDPKFLTTILIWLVFGVTLLVRKVVHLEGRKLVLLWMSGLALTLVSMTIINAFGTEFHSFM